MDLRADLLEHLRAEPATRAVLDAVAGRRDVHLVGGSVRDALLWAAPRDLDFAVEGDALEVAVAVGERLGGEVLEHDRFGTARVSVTAHSYDFASARAERYARPGALPEVRPATLADDLRRRDFTVNAIALAAGGPHAGTLTAAPEALDDLDARRLRVLHDDSFLDDPTRLLRLGRYAARLGFAVEPHTAELARAAIAGGSLGTVSGSRIGQELRLAALEAKPVAAFERLVSLGVLRALHPRFGPHTEFTRRALVAIPPDGRADLVVLAACAPDVPHSLLDRLGFDREEARLAAALADRLPEVARRLASAQRPSEIDAALAGSTAEEAALVAALGSAEAVARWLGDLRRVALEIDGADLRAAGVPEGPAIGAALASTRAGRLDGDLMTREAQLAFALRMAGT
ncbi:MAG: hypothetical protein ACR2K9_06130 [Solirubrobacteraceae bacterium]